MSDTLESLERQMEGARELESVVRTMKAMAGSNIRQYEMAVRSLGEYYHNIALGIIAYFRKEKIDAIPEEQKGNEENLITAIVFGSDQGLVGQFNDLLSDFAIQSLKALPGKKEVWSVGERIQLRLSDSNFIPSNIFTVPNSVNAITSLIGEILVKIEESQKNSKMVSFYIFHNHPKKGAGYEPMSQRLLPLDETWRQGLVKLSWPTKNLPEVVGGIKPTLLMLIREYLFVSLFKACAESLASENSSRLAAMQRAEKNIDDLLDGFSHKFHRLRQSSIDEELFDVISGFEALKGTSID
jgi:F-type H+-transporting ATPase subunit gamma